ncbi:MAG: YchJ family metal-binding protein [Actinomycetota bacterium]|nr:YchJ family metal-binding protein [Actinomycetota bacterium]
MDDDQLCPCGSGATLAACCGPVVRGDRPAPTAERLMRSRYTAFVLRDEAHLLRSWHPSTRPADVRFAPGQAWTGLEVLATTGGELIDQEGTVEFIARFERRGRPGALHELSRFLRDDGRWTYVEPVDAELD